MGDCIMVFLTCGLWLIWIFVREMRRRSSYSANRKVTINDADVDLVTPHVNK